VLQTAAAVVLCITDRAGVQPIGLAVRLNIRSPGLPFNGLHPCNPHNYMDYYSFTDLKGMEGCVGLVG